MTETPGNTRRLMTQVEAVRNLMLDGEARSLERIAYDLETRYLIKATIPSISARLRDLRKPQFGGYTVTRTKVVDGVYAYRVIHPPVAESAAA